MTDSLIAERYRLDGIVTTIDLATGLHNLDHHVEAVKQAAMADCLLLTKADLASTEECAELLLRLDGINPAATRWTVTQGEIDATKLLDLGLFSTCGKAPDVERWLREEAYSKPRLHLHHQQAHGIIRREFAGDHGHHHHDVNRHDDHIRAFCFSVEIPIPEEVLAAWLEVLMRLAGSNILRVKGILNVAGSGLPVVIHGVQHIFHPPTKLPAWPSEDRRSRIVFITKDVEREAIEKTFHAFRDYMQIQGAS